MLQFWHGDFIRCGEEQVYSEKSFKGLEEILVFIIFRPFGSKSTETEQAALNFSGPTSVYMNSCAAANY